MSRRKPWSICLFLGITTIVVINFQPGQDSHRHQPMTRIWTENLDLYRWLPSFKAKTRTISQPDVNIEVNGHSILFKNLSTPKSSQKIRIHLIFHSHVDPGWLRTFEEYYVEKVRNILTYAVESLHVHPSLRFIWSETSFLERWWQDATEEQKKNMLGQISRGQLEISGGSWVMTDEATPTFYSAIENMIEGHGFIQAQFNITPRTSWSVDPFGHGAMMPELLHRAGVEAMVIGRFHEHLKQEMRKSQVLRWHWIPPYFEKLEGPRVNALPRTVYTTYDACETSKICSCYQVGPSALYQSNCPDRQLINKMTAQNLDHLTRRFVDQMRKTQLMYGTEDLLVPIGDDFFFSDPQDWKEMYAGYFSMIEWLKQHPEEGAEMRFSTVSEFFDSIKGQELPSLRGDFFPYTSNMVNEHPWWTGYFVHRPVTKTMERRLQNCLRSLDILTMLAGDKQRVNVTALTEAKRQLMLFQHHDGITGTSKPHVMKDYEDRMKGAFLVFTSTYSNLLFPSQTANFFFDPVHNRNIPLTIPQNGSLILSIFCSQTSDSKQLVNFLADRLIKVTTLEGKEIESSSTKMRSHNNRDDPLYKVAFFAPLSPLSITSFTVSSSSSGDQTPARPVRCFNFNSETRKIEGLIMDGSLFPLNLSLFEIVDTGGSYVIQRFQWWDEGDYLEAKKVEHFEDGLVQSLEISEFPNPGLKMRLACHGEGDLALEIDTDVSRGTTLALELDTGIENDAFYTDVNGMYHLERKYSKSFNDRILPWEANIFPVATSTFFQDDNHRLTVVTAQPTGALSDVPGKLHVLVDRWLAGNDGKGLAPGDAFDNRTSTVRYRILLEKRQASTGRQSFMSQKGEQTVSEVLYPPISVATTAKIEANRFSDRMDWPCGIQLVSWRLLSENVGVLILRRLYLEDLTCPEESLEPLYHRFIKKYGSLHHAKLSATVDLEETTVESFIHSLKEPFSIAAFRFHL